jgi:hypothetical protein
VPSALDERGVLETCLLPGHTDWMGGSACKDCGMYYTARPEQRPEGHSGGCDCVDCGKTLLERSGFHGFYEGDPDTLSFLSPRTDR